MAKFRKKPVEIEAYQTDKEMDIETLEGVMHASIGDWIITGVDGEQYPCKPDIFEKTYEPVCVYEIGEIMNNENNNIKIGDEVIIQGNYPEIVGIVTHNDSDHFCYMLKDGISYHCRRSFANPKKTGRYFPEMQNLLDALNMKSADNKIIDREFYELREKGV